MILYSKYQYIIMKTEKHIGFIISKMVGGGAERVTSLLVNKFIEKGYKVTLITYQRSDNEYYIDPRVNRVVLKYHGKSIKGFIKNTYELFKLIKNQYCDVYISFDVLSNLCVTANKIFVRKIKLILTERNAPNVVEIKNITKYLGKLLYGYADYFVFQTEEAKHYYSKYIQQKSVVIPNPIKSDLPYKSKKNNEEIVAIGRLEHQKNYPLLINAFAKLIKDYPEYTLIIYGQGRLEKELKDQVHRLNIDKNVWFKGYKENVHNEITNSDIYIMTSDYEGMPNALMEVMAMGFPVISTDCPVGGPKQLITDGENGFLIKVGDQEELLNRMKQLISNEKLKTRFSKNAINIREKYSLNNIIKLWETLILDVIER